ncbi:MAG TPA: CAP domain-containing protein [Planctomycetota bacterium]|nr:CAP domain-containing protein [Planctomycetota bacterium]
MELIGLINSYRVGQGLAALEYDKELTRCARGHSRHHHEHGFFQGHVNPEGDDFVDRMARNGIASSKWGENISYGAFSPQVAFDGWLNSPPHVENMVRDCFTRIGVGCHVGVWTANFAR